MTTPNLIDTTNIQVYASDKKLLLAIYGRGMKDAIHRMIGELAQMGVIKVEYLPAPEGATPVPVVYVAKKAEG